MRMRTRAQRIARLTPAEVATRAAQSARILVERCGAAGRGCEPSIEQIRSRLVGGGTPTQWLDGFRRRPPSSFFAGLADRRETLAVLEALHPGACERAVTRATRVLEGEVDMLGHRGLRLEDPVDWHRDPVSGRRSPLQHWSRVRYLDSSVTGDHKLVWELNRHHHLVVLGQAFWMSGERRFADAALRQLASWLDANPPKLGINWASSLEMAIRVVSWTWLLHFVRDAEALEPALFARVLGAFDAQGRHIERNLSTYFSPNTHLTGEALGLLYLGCCFPQFASAARWCRLGWRVLDREIPRQVHPDGVYFEQASWYARYTADFLVHALSLCERAGRTPPLVLTGRLERLLEHLAFMSRPDGTTPLVGDDDGGRLLPLDGPPDDDFRATLYVGASMVGRKDLMSVAAGRAEELIWLRGPASAAVRLDDGVLPPAGQRVFPDGGTIVLRDGWTSDADHLHFDCGPHGALSCGHAHADALAVDLSVGGRAIFVDPGTFTYTTDPGDRDWHRGMESHNTVVLDDQPFWVPGGPFSWRRGGAVSLDRALAHGRVDYLEGSQNAGTRRYAAVRHSRAVVCLRGDYWIIRDRVLAAGVHRATARFQLAEGLRAEATGDGAILVGETSVPGLPLLTVWCAGAAHARIESGWVSRAYGTRTKVPRLALRSEGEGILQTTTVVLPRRIGACVAEERLAGARAIRISTPDWVDTLVLGDGEERLVVDGVDAQARLAWVRRHRDGSREYTAIDAASLVIDGSHLIVARTPCAGGIIGAGDSMQRLTVSPSPADRVFARSAETVTQER